MKKRILLILKLFLVLTLILIGLAYAFTGFQFGDNNSIIETVPSPNGKYVACLFIRDMGATTKESYQLSIFKKGRELGNSPGNTFISYGEFNVEWKNDSTLFVNNSTAEIFKQDDEVNGITVNYAHISNK